MKLKCLKITPCTKKYPERTVQPGEKKVPSVNRYLKVCRFSVVPSEQDRRKWISTGTWSFHLNIRKLFLLWGSLSDGTGKLWSLYPWTYSKVIWTGTWASFSIWSCWRKGWYQMPSRGSLQPQPFHDPWFWEIPLKLTKDLRGKMKE